MDDRGGRGSRADVCTETGKLEQKRCLPSSLIAFWVAGVLLATLAFCAPLSEAATQSVLCKGGTNTAQVTVLIGESITWTVRHDEVLTIFLTGTLGYTPIATSVSGILEFTFQFTVPGDYKFLCSKGGLGNVTVHGSLPFLSVSTAR